MPDKTNKKPIPARGSKPMKNKWVVLPIYFAVVVILSTVAWMRILNPLYPWQQRNTSTPPSSTPALADNTPTIPPVVSHPELPELTTSDLNQEQSTPTTSSLDKPATAPLNTDNTQPNTLPLAIEDPSAPPLTTGLDKLPLLVPEEPIETVLAAATVYQAPDPADNEMIWPVDPINIIVRHGRHLSKTMEDWRHHNGIDIEAAEGTAVKAALNGKVVRTYNDAQLGEVIILEHANGLKTKYANLVSADLAIGKAVKRGDIIGKVGKTARYELADLPHLHFEILKDDVTIDSLEILKP